MQRRQFALVKNQQERTERIQDQAEEMQAKGAQLVAGSRKAFVAALPPVIVLLTTYLSLLLRRRGGRAPRQLPCWLVYSAHCRNAGQGADYDQA